MIQILEPHLLGVMAVMSGPLVLTIGISLPPWTEMHVDVALPEADNWNVNIDKTAMSRPQLVNHRYVGQIDIHDEIAARHGVLASFGYANVDDLKTSVVVANMSANRLQLPAGTAVATLTPVPVLEANSATSLKANVQSVATSKDADQSSWWPDHLRQVLSSLPLNEVPEVEETQLKAWINANADRFVSTHLGPDRT